MKTKYPPRIEQVHVKNYRALADITLDDLTPFTTLVGANGSGKSTMFDVFAFLSECFQDGLRRAWDKRGRFAELRTRGASGPIVIEIKYREHEQPKGGSNPLITYHLAIDEESSGPVVAREFLRWKRQHPGAPFKFLDFGHGKGQVISGEMPDQEDERISENLDSPDLLAANTLGQLASHPRVAALRRFITSWYLSYLSVEATHHIAESGPQERLSQDGRNLANVIQYLEEQHPVRLRAILDTLAERIPRLEKVTTQRMLDGRLLLRFKDEPFEEPVQAKYASDGTIKMLAYLVMLYDPSPPQIIGIEEPENFLHPQLLGALGEECRAAGERSQLIVTTHSSQFVDAVQPEELWLLHRDAHGLTRATRAPDIAGVREFMAQGALLGDLWMEGHLRPGDPQSRPTQLSRVAEGPA